MKKVTFENVGRDKQNWTEDMREVSESALYRAIKKRRALASKGVWCDLDTGMIYAGGRAAGTFSISDV